MASETARVLLAGIRIVNGAAGVLAPNFLAKRVSPQPEPNPAAFYAFRLFGIRTVKVGADLLSGDATVRDHAARAAPGIHLSDTMTAGMLLFSGRVTKRAGIMLTAISALNVVLALKARPPG
jgi:hypothetical protein